MNHLSCSEPVPIFSATRRMAVWLAMGGLAASALVVYSGCRPSRTAELAAARTSPVSDDGAWRSELFDAAVVNLNRLEQFDSPEMLQQIVNRFDQWARKQSSPPDWKADPDMTLLAQSLAKGADEARALAGELARLKSPEKIKDLPARLRAAVDQIKRLAQRFRALMLETGLGEFNGWITQTEALANQVQQAAGATDPVAPVRAMADRIKPEEVETVGNWLEQFARRLDPSRREFLPRDGMALQEAVWLRDVSRWASGEERDDPLKQACRLFDWTVRNIQVDAELPVPQGGERLLQAPWETLLVGHGTAMDRAWIFILLLRQQRIDAGLVALIDPEDPTKQRIRPWAVGVLIDKEVYLFDSALGLPVPGPQGLKLTDGQLDVVPATLSQIAGDDKLLRQLDVDPEHPYRLNSKQVQEVVVLLEASPDYLSERMRLIESRLAGKEATVLTTSMAEQAARFRACRHVFDCMAWRLPYQVIYQEIFFAPQRARWQLQQMAAFQVGPNRVPALRKGRVYHLKGMFTGEPSATTYYQMARLSERQLDSAQLDSQIDTFIRLGKVNSTYWMGLMAFEQRQYDSTIDYVKARVLDTYPRSPWTFGAKYNLARAYEASGKYAEAVALYREKDDSPTLLGNLLRGKWLESVTAPPKSWGLCLPPS